MLARYRVDGRDLLHVEMIVFDRISKGIRPMPPFVSSSHPGIPLTAQLGGPALAGNRRGASYERDHEAKNSRSFHLTPAGVPV
jgi:hypothetical protein